MTTWPEVLSALVARTDLSTDQATWAMGEILSGEATPAQIAGFAVSLRAKGETVEEITGLVAAMYEKATPIQVHGRLLDVVGTDISIGAKYRPFLSNNWIVSGGAAAFLPGRGFRPARASVTESEVVRPWHEYVEGLRYMRDRPLIFGIGMLLLGF